MSLDRPNKETLTAMLEAERIAKDENTKDTTIWIACSGTWKYERDEIRGQNNHEIQKGSQTRETTRPGRQLLKEAISILATGGALPERYRDHALTGNLSGFRECHILPDLLLVYLMEEDVLVLTLVRTGTHSDLFGK